MVSLKPSFFPTLCNFFEQRLNGKTNQKKSMLYMHEEEVAHPAFNVAFHGGHRMAVRHAVTAVL